MRSISRRLPYQRSSPTQQLSEAANAANRTQILSAANEQYENRSKLLRYHYKQEPLRMQRKQRSGIQTANSAAGSATYYLSGARAPAYCLLAADSICRNLKDLLQRLRIEWLFRALPDFGLLEDERKQSTTKQSIGTILLRWKKAGKIEQVEGLAKFRQLKKN